MCASKLAIGKGRTENNGVAQIAYSVQQVAGGGVAAHSGCHRSLSSQGESTPPPYIRGPRSTVTSVRSTRSQAVHSGESTGPRTGYCGRRRLADQRGALADQTRGDLLGSRNECGPIDTRVVRTELPRE